MKKAEAKITTKYNILLFFILIIFQSIISVFEYKEEQEMLVDKIFNYDVLIGSAIFIILFALSAVVGVWLIRSFWDRFVSQIFQVRALTVNEAISIILIISIFSMG